MEMTLDESSANLAKDAVRPDPPERREVPRYNHLQWPWLWELKLMRQQKNVAKKDRQLAHYSWEDYRPFLNTEIEEAAGIDLAKLPNADEVVFELGATQWTHKEFETFFRALARKGRNAAREIANTIKSKSEVETQCLLLHFHAASQQTHARPTYARLDAMTDIPAAAEVSTECCEAVDGAADALSWMCDKNDIGSARLKHGANWLLDMAMAKKLTRAYEREERANQLNPHVHGDHDDKFLIEDDSDEYPSEESGLEPDSDTHGKSNSETGSEPHSDNDSETDAEAQDTNDSNTDSEAQDEDQSIDDGDRASVEADVDGEGWSSSTPEPSKEDVEDEQAALEYWPSARLLNAPIWLELMDEVFMRQVPSDESHELGRGPDWKKIALQGQEPSIFFNAFSDFYNLAVSVTRRVVRAAINQALSRTRAQDYWCLQTRKPTASKLKVFKKDAIVALELLDMRKTLHQFFSGVTRTSNIQIPERPYCYLSKSEVEQRVAAPSLRRQFERAHATADEVELSDTSNEASDTSNVESSGGEDQDGLAAGTAPVEGSRIRKRKRKTETAASRFEFITKAFDRSQDIQEEMRLWKIVRRNPPRELLNEHVEVPSRKGRTHRTRRMGLRVDEDWRDLVDYRAEWETYGHHHIPPQDFWITDMVKDRRRAKRVKREQEASERMAARRHERLEHPDASDGEALSSAVDEAEESEESDMQVDEEMNGNDETSGEASDETLDDAFDESSNEPYDEESSEASDDDSNKPQTNPGPTSDEDILVGEDDVNEP
ncbi:MAG: hypothetical protein M1822_005174 [Bathelium mastoideum]|nr:MAG: hypothetical protein M1822_005174 [Bathelium mastoideum]